MKPVSVVGYVARCVQIWSWKWIAKRHHASCWSVGALFSMWALYGNLPNPVYPGCWFILWNRSFRPSKRKGCWSTLCWNGQITPRNSCLQRSTRRKRSFGKIVEAITFAPPSITPLKIELAVVQDAETMRKALPEMIDSLWSFGETDKQPFQPIIYPPCFWRWSIPGAWAPRCSNGGHPLARNETGMKDTIMRNAPAMIIFHAHRKADNYETDVDIAMTYGLLAAHSLGLGVPHWSGAECDR